MSGKYERIGPYRYNNKRKFECGEYGINACIIVTAHDTILLGPIPLIRKPIM